MLNPKTLKPGFKLGTEIRKTYRCADDMKGHQLISIGHPLLIAEQQLKQCTAILAARDRHRYPIALCQQIELLAGPSYGLEEKRRDTLGVTHRLIETLTRISKLNPDQGPRGVYSVVVWKSGHLTSRPSYCRR